MRRGFTFIEALATLVVLGIVLPAVMAGISLSLSAGELARQRSRAAALAHDKLMELAATDPLQHASLSGDCGQDRPDYRWTAQISEWGTGSLRQLDVTVVWHHRRTERTVTMSTLVAPAETEAQ